MENKCESESCGCSKSDTQNQCCGQQECGCNSSGNCCNEYDKIAMLMYVAKKAKIKKRLESLEGKKLDQTADLVVEAMMDCHKNKMDIEKKQQDMREKFEAIFSKD